MILSTSSGIEISVNEEKISNTNEVYYHVKSYRKDIQVTVRRTVPGSSLSRRNTCGVGLVGGRLRGGGGHVMNVEMQD